MVEGWIREGRLAARVLGVDFVKALAYGPSWDESAWLTALRSSDREWAHHLEFGEARSDWAFELLGDPRAFSGDDIGVAWLLDMVRRSEARYHDFAVSTLTRSFSPADFSEQGDAMEGAHRLLQMAVEEGPPDEPVRRFALTYLELHHPVIHREKRQQDLLPGLELPDGFLTLDRALGLVSDERSPVRRLGIAWMRVELVGWAPSPAVMVQLAELPYDDVHDFVVSAFTAEDKQEHRRYRLDPEQFQPDMVYRFCESLDARTRALGMRLIGMHARLAVPEELFRLTESPDRTVRAFVVRQLWGRYRQRPSSAAYRPPTREGDAPLPAPPASWPAPEGDIRVFLRRTLFGIPPARLPKGGRTEGLRRLPARQAKLSLIEVCRDLALEDSRLCHPCHAAVPGVSGQSWPSRVVGLPRCAHPYSPSLGRHRRSPRVSAGGQVSTKQHWLTYRGQLQGLVAQGAHLLFVTDHREQHPTGVYRLDPLEGALEHQAMPGGVDLALGEGEHVFVAGADARIWAGPFGALAPITAVMEPEPVAVAPVRAGGCAVLGRRRCGVVERRRC